MADGDGYEHIPTCDLTRGVVRLCVQLGLSPVTELTLANGRRADVAALCPKGEIEIVEIKSSVADFRSDQKWPKYAPFCDRFYFAVSAAFPSELIPDDCGLIIADAYGGAVVRPAQTDKLSAARRKAVTLKFARLAALRAASCHGIVLESGPDLLNTGGI
ncbi:MAG: MmcB family DNA repair protein [Pseudomonadota bacterium]